MRVTLDSHGVLLYKKTVVLILIDLIHIVAGHEVSAAYVLEFRHILSADVACVGAAGAEGTARGGVQGAGDVAGQDNALVFPFRYPMKLDTATFGGVSTNMCTCSMRSMKRKWQNDGTQGHNDGSETLNPAPGNLGRHFNCRQQV